jgi:hypothetical protein
MKCMEIKNYNSYLIYEDGRVWSKKTRRFIKQSLNRGGYFILNLCRPNQKPKSHRVHRLVAEHFLPYMEGLKDVNHIDGNKQNNHISNLEWSNKSLNGKHSYKLGLSKASPQLGEKHGMSVLKEEDIIKIRELHGKISNRDIAKMYEVTPTQIGRIVTRKCWKHI